MGDFFAHDIGLGHVAGLPYLAAALVVILVVERLDRAVHEIDHWLAIIVVRTAATNLADFFSVDMRLPKPWVMAALALLLALGVAAAWRLVWRAPLDSDAKDKLLQADAGYWLAMLIAGTLGTVMGDFFSHDLHLGDAVASAVLSAFWPLFLFWACAACYGRFPCIGRLSLTIRAAGTAVGDLLAGRHALGLPLSTAVSGLALMALLILWKNAKSGAITMRSSP